jgi:two-component system, NtrC family, response regulator GlrR
MSESQTATVRTRRTTPLAVRVVVDNREAVPQECVLRGGSTLVLGAGRRADVVIDDREVSRRHAELTLVPEGVGVRDLGSRNGTFYLGQRVHQMALAPGSAIVLGGATARLEPMLEPAPLDEVGSAYGELLGNASASRELFALLHRLEGSLVSVLITGESGAGKELVARAIHQHSALANEPLVVVNCAALRGDLVRSELFGHRKGAFTGAHCDRRGAFELADGGTLFLDEVGELPTEVQPLLLRALEANEVQRLGDNFPRPVKVRLLAATHRNLPKMVENGELRGDLYYRLVVVALRVPPLRERRADIPLLAEQFARRAGLSELPPNVAAAFAERPWHGNARELRNAVHAYVALGSLEEPANAGEPLQAALSRIVDLKRPFHEQLRDVSATFAKTYLRALLDACAGNQAEAARRAGLDRSYFRRLLKRYRAMT